jgi:hypothetical protein
LSDEPAVLVALLWSSVDLSDEPAVLVALELGSRFER